RYRNRADPRDFAQVASEGVASLQCGVIDPDLYGGRWEGPRVARPGLRQGYQGVGGVGLGRFSPSLSSRLAEDPLAIRFHPSQDPSPVVGGHSGLQAPCSLMVGPRPEVSTSMDGPVCLLLVP